MLLNKRYSFPKSTGHIAATVVGNEHGHSSSNLINNLEKGMNLSLLP